MNKLDELVKPYLPTDEEVEMCKSYCDRRCDRMQIIPDNLQWLHIPSYSVDEIRNALILSRFIGDKPTFNSLMRNGINSIEKLDAVSLDTLSKFRCIGSKRLNKLAELKEMMPNGR